ncbi:hypothetical protein [Burkholderia alba]|uniref:hypothetical protein n=1 Tax=Burkholderia alba TaxID=2683677 RepID=UPI002B0602BA|nr:hypothetical protein [Burkholderia alba]
MLLRLSLLPAGHPLHTHAPRGGRTGPGATAAAIIRPAQTERCLCEGAAREFRPMRTIARRGRVRQQCVYRDETP